MKNNMRFNLLSDANGSKIARILGSLSDFLFPAGFRPRAFVYCRLTLRWVNYSGSSRNKRRQFDYKKILKINKKLILFIFYYFFVFLFLFYETLLFLKKTKKIQMGQIGSGRVEFRTGLGEI